ncbi:short-chain dehydrogenase/reductase family 16C member 6-like [Corticium candelabrum]|uniref:short-chain dehydrogenase/reductase family 16C member 6-like n=1 Tax=Corticium candelabrum TaxID=121492 RepID=UPI002E266DF6|nr:short-chain dehydrogenase/reductase family 16C member 6-like [Corticium candelabrum]
MPLLLQFFLLLLRICGHILLSLIRIVFPKSRRDLKGEVVLITGGANGIGRQMAHTFALRGCTVVVLDVDQAGLDTVKKELHKEGHVVHCYKCDCSNREQIYQVAETVRKEVDDVSILVNNAGILIGKKFLDLTDKSIEKVFNINSLAHFGLSRFDEWGCDVSLVMSCTSTARRSETCKAFLPAMLKSSKGHIVTIASVAGLYGTAGLSDYCASKFATVGFIESLRQEIRYARKDGVHVTLVCPYHVATDLGRDLKIRYSVELVGGAEAKGERGTADLPV